MVLSPIFIIFQVINAFLSLGHNGYTSMIKLSEITKEIKKSPISYLLYSAIYVSNITSFFPVVHKIWRSNKRAKLTTGIPSCPAHPASDIPIEREQCEENWSCGTDIVKSHANESIFSNDSVCGRELPAVLYFKNCRGRQTENSHLSYHIRCDLSNLPAQ
jgi:hypothetical protein